MGLIARLCLAAVFIALVFAARLVFGPIHLPVPEGALTRIAASVAPGWHVEAAGMELDLFADDGLSGLKLRDVRLTDPDGLAATAFPSVGLRLALTPAESFAQAVSIREIRLAGASLDIAKAVDGSFHLGLVGLGRPPGRDRPKQSFDASSLRNLPRISIIEARLTYRDVAADRILEASRATLTLAPSDGRLRAVLDTSLATEDGRITTLRVEAERSFDDGDITVLTEFRDADLSTFAWLDPSLTVAEDIRVALDGVADFALDPAGKVTSAAVSITATEPGTMTIAGEEHRLDALEARLTFGSQRTDIAVSHVRLSGPVVSGQGDVSITHDRANLWSARADLKNLSLASPEVSGSLSAGAAHVKGFYDAASDTVMLSTMALTRAALQSDDLDAPLTVARMAGSVNAGLAGSAPVFIDRLSLEGVAYRDGAQFFEMVEADLSATVDRMSGAATITAFEAGPMETGDGTNTVEMATIKLAAPARLTPALVDLADVRITGTVLTVPEYFDAPLAIDAFSAALNRTEERFALTNAALTVKDVSMRGSVRMGEGGAVGISLAADRLPIGKLVALWPKGVSDGALRWVDGHIAAGIVENARIEARFDPSAPQDDRLDIDFGFRDAIASPVPGLPPLVEGRGRASVTLDCLDVELDHARLPVAPKGDITVRKARFAIPDFAADRLDSKVDLMARGTAPTVLAFLGRDPLDLAGKIDLDPASTIGDIDARVRLSLPLFGDLVAGDIDFDIKANVRDFSLREPHIDATVTGEAMLLTVKPDGMTVRSDARIDGLAARVVYTHRFDIPPKDEPEGVLTAESYLTREDFARRMGMDIDAYFDGVAVLDAKIDMFPGGGARFSANADLTASSLRIDPVGWRKGSGTNATLALDGFRNPNGRGRIETIRLRGDGIVADGSLTFAGDRSVEHLRLGRLRLGQALDIGIDYRAGFGGRRHIDLVGPYLDLRKPFSDAMNAERDADSADIEQAGRAITLAARVGLAVLRDDLTISGLDGDARLSGTRLDALDMSGALAGKVQARISAERRQDGLALQLKTANAGAFLDAASVFKGADGGRLELDAFIRDAFVPAQIFGSARIDGITVHNSRTMRSILSEGAIGSLARQMLQGGLVFDRVSLPFSGIGGRWTLTDGVAYGDTLGLTLSGTHDIARKTLALDGTLSPAYAINGALGAVPLLGKFLTGGEGEGVFGVTFSVAGTTDAPRVFVNPLSALAPGFLRKIVSGVTRPQTVARSADPGGTAR